MKITQSIAFVIVPALLFVCGCVESVHPFYNDQQVAYDPSLAGTWKSADGPEMIVVEGQDDNKVYKVTFIDKDKKTGHFIVHLANVSDRMLADVTPDSPQSDDSDEYHAMLLPLHTFMWIEKNANGLKITMMNPDWLKQFLTDHPDAVAHEKIEDGFVLTASPADLQAFCLAQLKTAGAYQDSHQILRLEPTSKP